MKKNSVFVSVKEIVENFLKKTHTTNYLDDINKKQFVSRVDHERILGELRQKIKKAIDDDYMIGHTTLRELKQIVDGVK